MRRSICKTKISLFYLVTCCLLGIVSKTSAQDNDSLSIYRLDERNLYFSNGYTIINDDPTAHRGKSVLKSSSSSSGTFWYGPYRHIPAGNYLLQFRLKVASNVSGSDLLNINATSLTSGLGYGLVIKPNMFRNSNEWQLFTLAITVPNNITDLEIRGTNFIGGITDLYLDFVNIMPGDLRGFYSNELTLTGTGNVGIGTANPTDKLSVNGRIRSQEVKVEMNNWPDYVFDKDYQLPSLNETEKQIKEQGHLPGIPSAKEIKANGVDLGDMNAKLLKKIEELTLYLIEMKNENKVIKQRLIKLEKP